MRSFRFQLLVLFLAATAAYGAGPGDAKRRVVFLLDRSGSMPAHPYAAGFGNEVQSAARAAATILDEVERFGDTSVDFYTFGNKDGLEPRTPDALNLAPAEAKTRLPMFFATDPNFYSHRRTYIAHSIYHLVKQQLGLGADYGPEDNLPEDAPLLNVFVFTDGGEDPDPGFDNSPYLDWLERHKDRLQVRWQTWKFFAQGAELADRERRFSPSPADFVAYSVRFGVPTNAYSFSTAEPPANRTVNLELPHVVRLIPAIPGDPLTDVDDASPCVSESQLAATNETTVGVQAQIDWPAATAATADWPFRLPGREVLDVTLPQHATPIRTLSRRILQLNMGAAPAVLDVSARPGRYPVRLIRDSLCEELKRAYPSSRFVFPASDATNALPPLGFVTVENVPIHTFAIAAEDGAKPNDALVPVTSDRWHHYATSQRKLRITGPPGVDALIDATVLVRHDGKTEPEYTDFVSLVSRGTRAGALTVRPGDHFEVQVPATPQKWLTSVIEQGFRRPPGDYELVLRVRPRLAQGPGRYKVRIACENCDPARFSFHDDYALLRIPVEVRPRPLSWIIIAILTLVALAVLWVLIRWVTRPQFPKGFTIGILQDHQDLRAAHSHGLKGKLAVYKRQPLYIELLGDGQTAAMIDPLVDHNAAGSRNMLGLRPSSRSAHVWCVVKNGDVKIELQGNAYEPIGSTTPSADEDRAHQLLYSDVTDAANLVVSKGKSVVDTYTVVSSSQVS